MTRHGSRSSEKTWVEKDLIKSRAARELTATAWHVLMVFHTKRQMERIRTPGRKDAWVTSNDGQIVFPYREAEQKYGISTGRFRDAISLLVRVGIIDIAHQGRGMRGDPSTYAFSERWRDYGTSRFQHVERTPDRRYIGYRGWRKREKTTGDSQR